MPRHDLWHPLASVPAATVRRHCTCRIATNFPIRTTEPDFVKLPVKTPKILLLSLSITAVLAACQKPADTAAASDTANGANSSANPAA